MSNRVILKRLDHLSLKDMAEYFEHQADYCRHQAVKSARSEVETVAAGASYLVTAPRIVSRYLRKGESLEYALERTAKSLSVPFETIERTWKRFLCDKSLYELRRRNTLILELACLGLTNADIGRKVNLHPNSVSRIISSARSDYRHGRAVDEKKIQMLLLGGSDTPKSDRFA